MKQYPNMEEVNLPGRSIRFVVDNIRNTEIKKSEIHGYGLFATESIKSGSILCILDGQIVSWSSYDRIAATKPFDDYSCDLLMEWNSLEQDVLLLRPFRTKYSFINHSRKPNVMLNKHPVITLVSVKDIREGEEITIDYRNEPLNDDYIEKALFL
jgi:SET domain-containing protein